MALSDFEHPECICDGPRRTHINCPVHGVGTEYYALARAEREVNPQVTVPLNESGRIKVLSDAVRRQVDLLYEARDHAKLTQNLRLVAKIDNAIAEAPVL